MRVRREDVEFFRKNLWKDERHFASGPASGEHFLKDCFSEESASLEAETLLALSAVSGEQLAPELLKRQGRWLVLERVDGIRLFDLLRHLRQLELERRDGQASRIRELLMLRSRVRLRAIQEVLLEKRGELASVPYPMENKIEELLSLFIRVLEIPISRESWASELTTISKYWDSECASIPFRDATTKNTIVAIPELSVAHRLLPEERYRLVSELVDRGSEYWTSVPLLDVDFSSVEHLTSPEDDPISLFAHEWTYGSYSLTPASLLLLDSFEANPRRCAVTLMVRYLRFGGRKLAYMLINSQGFEVRFAYDDPLFYFKSMRDIVGHLDASLVEQSPALFGLYEWIATEVASANAADTSQLSVDHFRRIYGAVGEYWQENPIERFE